MRTFGWLVCMGCAQVTAVTPARGEVETCVERGIGPEQLLCSGCQSTSCGGPCVSYTCSPGTYTECEVQTLVHWVTSGYEPVYFVDKPCEYYWVCDWAGICSGATCKKSKIPAGQSLSFGTVQTDISHTLCPTPP